MKNQENVTNSQENRQSMKTNVMATRMFELANKDFKLARITIFNNLKENMFVILKR